MNDSVQYTVKNAQKDTLSDGSEVLFLELLKEDGEIIHDIIRTQEKLDEFLVSIGYPAGSMTLAGPTK